MCGRLRNSLINNRFYVTSILVAWVFLQPCDASTILYVVTPAGIVIGEDGMGIALLACGHVGPPRQVTVHKIVLLRGQFALGNIGLGRQKVTDGRAVGYDFPTFAEFIDYNLGPDATVPSLLRLVEDESPKALSFMLATGKDGSTACRFGKDKTFDDRVPLVQYVIAGYEQGVPLIYNVNLKIDWEKNNVIAVRVPIEPFKGQHVDARTGAFGSMWLFSIGVCQAQTDYYKKAIIQFPRQLRAYCADNLSGDFSSLKEASDAVRVLLQVYTGFDPRTVGFPLTIVTIPKTGRSSIRTYSNPFPSLPDSQRRQKKKQKQP